MASHRVWIAALLFCLLDMVATLLIFLLLACAPPAPPPDAVWVGPVWDGALAGSDRALVLRDGVLSLEAPDAWPDAPRAAAITAGFVDAHAHPAGLGRTLEQVDLVGAPTLADTLARVRAGADGTTGWVTGRGWDQNDWADHDGYPTAAQLDAVVGDRLAALRRVDGHATWVSTAVLKATGITAATADPPGGRIVRDGDGVPTGVLIDNAGDLVSVPGPDAAGLRRQVEKALAAIVAEGLAGVHAMGCDDATLAVYEALARDGALPIRLWVYVDQGSAAEERLVASGPWSVGRLHVVGVKAYADGALGSRGALLSAPYADEPDGSGLPVMSAAALTELATRVVGGGVQVAIHAIGDLGVTHALDAFAAARAAHPDEASVRLRVEHAQVVNPSDVPRFAELDVVASMQPTHATSDMPWAEARLGPERVKWSYTWSTLRRAGALLAFGSDFPVERVDPGLGVYAAVERRDPATGQPAGGWRIDEAVSLEVAVHGFTRGAAEAVGEELPVGTLAGGDATVWRTVTEGAVTRWDAVATVVDGAVVWRASP